VPLALKSASAKPQTISVGTTKVSYTLSANATVTATLRGADGRDVATLFQQQVHAGVHTFTFSAEGITEGRYTIVLSATDGKTTVTATVPVVVDRTIAALTSTPAAFSPNGDGRDDTLAVSFQLTRAAQARLDVKRGTRIVATIWSGTASTGAQSTTWNGSQPTGRIPDGTYSLVLTAVSTIGTSTRSVPLRVDTVPPRIVVVSFRRLIFRISEAATVTVMADGHRYVRSVRAGLVSLRIGHLARRVAISAVDAAGNVSRTLRFP
jgi:flagellar hook assembly protein FlgD